MGRVKNQEVVMMNDKILAMYDKGMSSVSICKQLKTDCPQHKWYPNKILRIIKDVGIVRTLSDAQKNAIDNGSSLHPTKGRKRTDKEKENISKGYDSYFDSMSEEEKKEYITAKKSIGKKNWDNKSEEERTNTIFNMRKEQKKNMKELGSKSKIEYNIYEELKKRGHVVKDKYVYEKTGEEIDILTGVNLAIEIDGPTHWANIYGEETFNKNIAKDLKKNEKLIAAGFFVLRVRVSSSKSSRRVRLYVDQIEQWINSEDKSKLTTIGEENG